MFHWALALDLFVVWVIYYLFFKTKIEKELDRMLSSFYEGDVKLAHQYYRNLTLGFWFSVVYIVITLLSYFVEWLGS